MYHLSATQLEIRLAPSLSQIEDYVDVVVLDLPFGAEGDLPESWAQECEVNATIVLE